ncbi:MAG TPA: hypothetical protein VGB00_12090 [Pyrinomonadaceae bacterium]|jgi:hypothetical protein
MRPSLSLTSGIYALFVLGCLILLNSPIFAQSQRYVQIDVRVVGGNPVGVEATEIDGKRIRAWDTAFFSPFAVPPDIKICVENKDNCVKSDCPNLYFCTFIGVPIESNTFSLEIWDADVKNFADNGDDLIGKGMVGVNRSYQIGLAQVTVTEIPCPDKQIQVNYEPKENTGHYQFETGFTRYPVLLGQGSSLIPASYHHLKRSKEICQITTPGCSVKTVYETMLSQVSFIAPSKDKKPVVNCKINELFAITQKLGGSNPVRSTIDAKNSTVVNYTLEKHIFYPGKITRKVIKSGNSIVVTTEGEGFGQYAPYNEFFGENVIFAEIDAELADAVKKKLTASK